MPKLPNFSEEELTPNVLQLLEVSHYQTELIQALRNEIAQLKGNKPKPQIKASNMDKGAGKGKVGSSSKSKKRPGSAKKKKTKELKIHKTEIVKAENIPAGSEFKGYKEFVVQNIVINSHNTLYRMERWQTPSGNYVEGELPPSVKGHFGSELVSYILYQYYQCHVTQPLLLEALHEFGIDISSGQINNILIGNHDDFHAEKDDILSTGLEISSYIQTDDTGARHNGKNGYCTHIGNEFFAWFESTDSKSRINFLKLLRAGNKDYVLNADAIEYMEEQKLPKRELQVVKSFLNRTFDDETAWQHYLDAMGIRKKRHVKIATEGALLGAVIANGFNKELVVLSDDAGQFDVMLHALCWIHAERAINKLGYFSKKQHQIIESKRNQIWDFYRTLKEYKIEPESSKATKLETLFDHIFTSKTSYISLDIVLERLYKNKDELLLVLKRPETPLHNNSSESDIREYVKKRKISGGTRSSPGRRSRDTFTSLKKTCRKLGVSFWDYLNDRVAGKGVLSQLSNLMRQAATTSTY